MKYFRSFEEKGKSIDFKLFVILYDLLYKQRIVSKYLHSCRWKIKCSIQTLGRIHLNLTRRCKERL